MSLPTINEFFTNKIIFITGATGFMGKVLLEKLLRSCPGIKKVYLIIRSHKGKPANERLQDIINVPLFDRIRDTAPESLDKVVAMEGDVGEHKLNLSRENYEMIVTEVNVVFHIAASVRFDDPLAKAVTMNTRGTREVLELGAQMKNLQSFIHVSTTYCNCNKKVVNEIVYPAPQNWKKVIEVIEKTDPTLLTILTPMLLNEFPNTYTFSKSLSEELVNSYSDRIPLIIFRPSIVISTWKDPVSGWIDNINGPASLILGAGKGILRTTLLNPYVVPDYMPVDIAIKGIIVSAWEKGVNGSLLGEVPVYNCSSTVNSVSNREIIEIGYRCFWRSPEKNLLWIPSKHCVSNRSSYYFYFFIKQLIPAILVDTLFRITGKEPMLVRIQRKVLRATLSLSHFTLNEWKFNNDNFLNLKNLILPEDKKDFDFDFESVNPEEFFFNAVIGGRKYLLKDPPSDKAAEVVAYRMYYFEIFVKIVFYSIIILYGLKCTLSFFNIL